jgi:hypothetical protein
MRIKHISAYRFLWFVLINTSLWGVCYQLHWVTVVENGGMENAQAMAIFLSLILFALSAIRQQFSERVFFSGLILLCFSFLLRELDMEDLGLTPMVTWLTSGVGRNLVVSLLWFFYLLFIFIYPSGLGRVFRVWAKSLEGRTMILAGIFLVLARPFDKELFPMLSSTARFVEELLELNGYMLIWISSFSSFTNTYADKMLLGLGKPGVRARLSQQSTIMYWLFNSLTNRKNHAVNRNRKKTN